MNQKALIGSGIALGVLTLSFLGATWQAGRSAQFTLDKQHKLIADLPYFVVKSRDYQRGLFSSQERTTLTLNPALIEPYFNILKATGQNLPSFELTYTQHVRHGPLPLLSQGNFTVLKAAVTTDIAFSEDNRKLLAKFFGDQKPLQIENRIGFNDAGVFTLKVPAFNYEETLAKVKSTWSGLDASIAYGGDFEKVDIVAKAPGFRLEAGEKGTFELKNLSFEAHNVRGVAGLMLGEGKLSLAELTAKINDKNKPLDVRLDTLDYRVKSGAQGDFIDASGDITLKTLTLNEKVYGPATLAVEAKHLHAPTLATLNQRMTALQKELPNPANQTDRLLKILRADGTPLLKNDPSLALKELHVKLPEGDLRLKADLALKGFEEADLDKPLKILEKLQASVDVSVPAKVIETYVLWQARSMIATDTSEGQRADTEDLDNLARNLMESQIRKLVAQNLIRQEGDKLHTHAEWKAGQLRVNGTEVPLPWQAGGGQLPR